LKELSRRTDIVHSGENQFEVPKIEKLNNEKQEQDQKPLLVGKVRDGVEVDFRDEVEEIESSNEKQQ
jgi:hypothetical protein